MPGYRCDRSLYTGTHGLPRRSRPMWTLSPVLEADRGRLPHYLKGKYSVPSETLLIDKAQLLTLDRA